MLITSIEPSFPQRNRVFAVAQFIMYMGLFAAVYYQCPDMTDNAHWRMWLIAAIACGILSSVTPSLVKDEVFFPYLPVLAPALIWLVIFTGKVFLAWSLSPLHDAAAWFCLTYLVGTPVLSVFYLLSAWAANLES